MKDEEIIPLIQKINKPTFFTEELPESPDALSAGMNGKERKNSWKDNFEVCQL